MAISPDGSLSVDGALVAKLRVDDFPPGTPLRQEGNNYISAPDGAGKPATGATILQGSVETSNSDAIRSTVALIDLERTSQIMEKALGIFHNNFNLTAVQEVPRV
jgi:flagellar basal-body rod protein FlgF/flagellar basal-body rod protein FlgG